MNWLKKRFRRRPRPHRDPTPEGTFRLLVLTDDPYFTFTGSRAWCDNQPYWEDGTCKCRHTDREDD